MTPDRAALIAWVKEQERRARLDASIVILTSAAADIYRERADHFAALHALLEELARYESRHGTLQPAYDKSFGDDRVCQCGHAYYRHFDTYEDMEPVGCKYCDCRTFAP